MNGTEQDNGVADSAGFVLPDPGVPVSLQMVSLAAEYPPLTLRTFVRSDEDCVFIYQVTQYANLNGVPLDIPAAEPLAGFGWRDTLFGLLYEWRANPTEAAKNRVVSYLRCASR